MRTTIISLVTACGLVFVVTAASAQGAIVFNHSEGKGEAFCIFVFPEFSDNVYTGPATGIVTPSGQINIQCNASLVFGVPVSETVVLKDIPIVNPAFGPLVCRLVVAPNGMANASCKE